jgi:hypothetical protein
MSTGRSAGAESLPPDAQAPGTSTSERAAAALPTVVPRGEPRAVPPADGTQTEPQLVGPPDGTQTEPQLVGPPDGTRTEPQFVGPANMQARLVYPPVVEERPSSRPVLVAAFIALLLLLAVGVILVRQGLSSASGADTRTGSEGQAGAVGADVVSEASFGPGLVVSQSQHVVFSQAVSALDLTVPQQTTTVSGGAFHPRIGNLQVLLGDGAPINVRQSLYPGKTVTVDLPGPTTRLDIVYVAYGAVVRSQPSSQHRAIALVNPLTLSSHSDMASTLHIDGTNVTNIGCTWPNGASQSCGSESSHGWTVTRGAKQQDVAVVAQLDLQG